MSLKDYYKILELTPGASVADIKKSFRRLALLYHPDRNFGSNIHEAKFKEIKEAYDVLSDTKQRQEYNSRRREQANEQRHSYSHSHSHSHSYSEPRSRTENKKTYSHPNAQTILNQTVEFRKRITAIDPERMNKKAVYHHIQKLLAIQNILILKHSNDPKINKDFIDEILNCARFLLFPEVEKICL